MTRIRSRTPPHRRSIWRDRPIALLGLRLTSSITCCCCHCRLQHGYSYSLSTVASFLTRNCCSSCSQHFQLRQQKRSECSRKWRKQQFVQQWKRIDQKLYYFFKYTITSFQVSRKSSTNLQLLEPVVLNLSFRVRSNALFTSERRYQCYRYTQNIKNNLKLSALFLLQSPVHLMLHNN